jgi:hypothetical protein
MAHPTSSVTAPHLAPSHLEPTVYDRHAPSWHRDAAAVAEAVFSKSSKSSTSSAASAEHGHETLEPPPAARIDWMVDDLDHFLLSVGGRSRFVFRAALTTLVTLGPVTIGSLRPFASLSLADRVRALERLDQPLAGPAALCVFAVKTLMSFLWFEHPDTQVEAGLVRGARP